MKPRLSTWFDQYDGLWGMFTVKKHKFTQRFDLQGHARVQIFTNKDVSVSLLLGLRLQSSAVVRNWLTGGGAPLFFPSLSPRVGAGVGVGLVYLVLEHDVFREVGLTSRDKILFSDWSPPLVVEELACRHVGQDKLFFRNAALYVKSCVKTFFSVKVMGKYVIQTWVSYDKRGT